MSLGKAIKYSPVMCNDGWTGGQSVLLMRDELGTVQADVTDWESTVSDVRRKRNPGT